MVLCRIEFWGGVTREVSCRLIASPELAGLSDLGEFLFAALGLEPAPIDLIPIFDESELHERNSAALLRRF